MVVLIVLADCILMFLVCLMPGSNGNPPSPTPVVFYNFPKGLPFQNAVKQFFNMPTRDNLYLPTRVC